MQAEACQCEIGIAIRPDTNGPQGIFIQGVPYSISKYRVIQSGFYCEQPKKESRRLWPPTSNTKPSYLLSGILDCNFICPAILKSLQGLKKCAVGSIRDRMQGHHQIGLLLHLLGDVFG